MTLIVIEALMKAVYTWIKEEFNIVINKRRGRKILENFKSTVWRTVILNNQTI